MRLLKSNSSQKTFANEKIFLMILYQAPMKTWWHEGSFSYFSYMNLNGPFSDMNEELRI